MRVAANGVNARQPCRARSVCAMYFGNEQEEERDPFEVFGELETTDEAPIQDEFVDDAVEGVAEETFEVSETADEPSPVHEYEFPEAAPKLKTGFSWAGFMGGLAALVWIGGAIGGPISY